MYRFSLEDVKNILKDVFRKLCRFNNNGNKEQYAIYFDQFVNVDIDEFADILGQVQPTFRCSAETVNNKSAWLELAECLQQTGITYEEVMKALEEVRQEENV